MLNKLTPFTSVLVANRGEIAMRVMRSARSKGLRIIAIYTDADANSLHRTFADEAVRIGEGPVGTSYLSIEKILKAAIDTGAEAIHPGYGFLSESAEFATACQKEGLVFIGPSAEAIELMGNKAAAKRRMIAANVPCVPGYEGEDQSLSVLVKAAKSIGFPLMVKATAGGGGRGMRLVHKPDELENGIMMARSEAENAFGSGELILEKAIIKPRHVEIQVFADRMGNTVHLGERDCSVQRRHQKVVEEAPCPIMTPQLRESMGSAAVNAAKSIGYEGAGTVEFLLDEVGEFYFLEMNTRLQVEHPVTELVTGKDLVAMQLDVAQGQPLGFDQGDVDLTGHAMEVRLYAEDPTNGFLPATGDVVLWQEASTEGLRIDTGIETGMSVSPYYDPMLAKIIAFGPDREVARARLIDGLKKTVLFGVPNNRDFLIKVLERQAFIDGAATTAFIEEEFFATDFEVRQIDDDALALAAALVFQKLTEDACSKTIGVANELMGWSSQGVLKSHLRLSFADDIFDFTVAPQRGGSLVVNTENANLAVSQKGDRWRVDGRLQSLVSFELVGNQAFLALGSRLYQLERIKASHLHQNAESNGDVKAPMHGLLLEVCVSVGDKVERGAKIAVLEAMKMQHELCAEISGVVMESNFTAGIQVKAEDLLVVIEGDTVT